MRLRALKQPGLALPVSPGPRERISPLVRGLHFGKVMITILVIVLIVALLGGGMGYGRYGAAGMSPAALIGIILVVMLLTGRL